jgi:hypothetical protein
MVEFTITDEALDFIVNKALEYRELVDYVRYVKHFNGCHVNYQFR